MEEGMMWFDNDQKSDLDSKVGRAVEYYQDKYGDSPNLCFVHPSMLAGNGKRKKGKKSDNNGSQPTREGVELRPSISMMPNHFWIGVEQLNS
jgi:hypothetical protein